MYYITDQFKICDSFKKDWNQDYLFSIETNSIPENISKTALYMVCDGVSNANGMEASVTAVNSAYPVLASLIANSVALTYHDAEMRRVFINQIMKKAVMTADAKLREMQTNTATTMSIAFIYDDTVYTCNIGDSPIYLLQLAKDEAQSVLHPLFQSHNKTGIDLTLGKITKEEAAGSRYKNMLLRYVGGAQALSEDEIFITTHRLSQDNILLIGSDGALSVFDENVLKDFSCETKDSMEKLCCGLYDKAYSTDAKDNFTLGAFRIQIY